MSKLSHSPRTPRRPQATEARHWIERQLRWEKTLGTLRGERSGQTADAKAA